MKRTLFILTFLLGVATPIFTSAQGWEWMKGASDSGSDNGQSQTQKVITDKHGNLYAAGSCWFNGHIGQYTFSAGGIGDIPLVKYDNQGNLQWALFGGDRCWVTGITIDSFDNLYMSGAYGDSVFTLGNTTIQYPFNVPGMSDSATGFLAKIDLNGNVKWLKNIGNIRIGAYGYTLANCIATDECGSIYWAEGFYNDFSVGNLNFSSNGGSDLIVAKFDSSGSILWGKTYGGKHTEWPACISVTPAHNIYLTGLFQSDTFQIGNAVLTDTSDEVQFHSLFFCKLNENGDPIWAQENGGGANCMWSGGHVSDADENLYLTGGYLRHWGVADGTLSLDTAIFPELPIAQVYGYVAKFNGQGNVQWANCVKGRYLHNRSIGIDHCRNVWVYGVNVSTVPNEMIKDTIDDQHILVAPVKNNNPSFLIGWDNDGNYLTSSIIATGHEIGHGLAVDNAGNIFIGGTSRLDTLIIAGDSLYNPNGSTGFQGHPVTMFVAKYQNSAPCSPLQLAPCWPAFINTTERTERITIYPNPTYDHLTIETNLSSYKLSLINTIGQHVYTKESCTANQAIDVSRLVNGVYYLRLETAERQVINKKVVVQH